MDKGKTTDILTLSVTHKKRAMLVSKRDRYIRLSIIISKLKQGLI